MKKFIGVVCILIVGFACGFYLSGAQVFSSFNANNTNTKQSAPLPASHFRGLWAIAPCRFPL